MKRFALMVVVVLVSLSATATTVEERRPPPSPQPEIYCPVVLDTCVYDKEGRPIAGEFCNGWPECGPSFCYCRYFCWTC